MRMAEGEEGVMRKRSALAGVVLAVILSVSMAVPAAAGPRTRVYKGETSQVKPFSVRVLKADDGQRYFKGFSVGIEMTCEDASTLEWGMGWYWGGRQNQLTDGVLVDLDEVYGSEALHIHGRIGQHRGTGTFKFTIAVLTPEEQAQTCTTGDLTWQVEYDHTASRAGSLTVDSSLDGVMKVHVAPDGKAATEVRSPA
jgi:hypothetical protein